MACQEKGKNRNALERYQHVCDHDEHFFCFDMNTNAGEYLLPSGDADQSVAKLAKSLASKIPVKSKNPSCKGDQSCQVLHSIHKSPDHLRISYEKPKYKWKKKPIQLLDEACKSEASLETIDTVLNGLKPETKGNISRIPVRVKYNKCCNCKFNDIMFSLKTSMKSLQEIEDRRTSSLKYSLQDQIPTITDESACLIHLDKFKKSKSLNQEVSTESGSREHDRGDHYTLPLMDKKDEVSYIPPTTTEVIRPVHRPVLGYPITEVARPALEYTNNDISKPAHELPKTSESWSAEFFRQFLSNLIVAMIVVLICKLFLQQFHCPSIVQSECMFSLW